MIRTTLTRRSSTLEACLSSRLLSNISIDPLRVIPGVSPVHTLPPDASWPWGDHPGFRPVAGAKASRRPHRVHQLTRRVDPETPSLSTLQCPISLTVPG